MRPRSMPYLLAVAILALAGVMPCPGAGTTRYAPQPPLQIPPLTLDIGFGGVVTPIAPQESLLSARAAATGIAAGKKRPELCPNSGGEFRVTPDLADMQGALFCIGASSAGLNVHFDSDVPFTTVTPLRCVALHGPRAATGTVVTFVARSGRRIGDHVVYDGGRAQCDLGIAFIYAYSVERLNVARSVGPGKSVASRVVTIPWKQLRPGSQTASIMVAVEVCALHEDCTTDQLQVEIPVRVNAAGASLALQYSPYVRIAGPTPAPQATPGRYHRVGLDAAWGWDERDLLMASFAQDQSTVATQRALAQALGISPLAAPSNVQMALAQTLQTNGQPYFTFQAPSSALDDVSLKQTFDTQPYSLSKLGSLASGYLYAFDSEPLKFAAAYGNQAQGRYSGAETVTLSLPTPRPSPEPSPRTLPPQISRTGAMNRLPLQPPPPPAPIVESDTANDPPLVASLSNSYVGSAGTRDAVDAYGLRAHVYRNATATYTGYHALTVDLFGELQHDLQNPWPSPPTSAKAQFAGESASFTSSAADGGESFWQLRETVGAQIDDPNFSPRAGAITWLAPLDGPVVHLTASGAVGPRARYYALDLFGFRLTNTNRDVATQEGVQLTVPLFSAPGWLLAGGTQTQVVSDRMAALEQGLVANYAGAVAEVIPTPAPSGIASTSPRRAQHLDNVSLQSPMIALFHAHAPLDVQYRFVAGYNAGNVTACNSSGSGKALTYQCLLQPTNHLVGGVFLQIDKLGIGATDTPALASNVGSSGAARNVGTSGSLPGAVTAFLTYAGCPALSAAYANAAFPQGVPLPQQGSTISAEMDYPLRVRATTFDLGLGYFNEQPATLGVPGSAGFFATLRLGAATARSGSHCAS